MRYESLCTTLLGHFRPFFVERLLGKWRRSIELSYFSLVVLFHVYSLVLICSFDCVCGLVFLGIIEGRKGFLWSALAYIFASFLVLRLRLLRRHCSSFPHYGGFQGEGGCRRLD
jgi:hypothetical protein